jgi:hypothetical protein
MNKLAKICLILAASLFVFGCAHEKSAAPAQQDDYGMLKHPSHHCKKCVDKLGENSMETAK